MPTPAGRVSSSLTVRGRCLVAGGGILLLIGAVLGEQALVQLAVFTLALPLLAALTVARERFRLTVRRTVTPARVPRGGSADVHLQVGNADFRAGRLWILTEQLPAALGSAPRFLVERLAGGTAASLHYRVDGTRRGRHALGPLRLRLVDPFGLVERSAVGADTAPLIVVPRVRPLGAGGPSGGRGGGGEGARRSIAVHGEDDVSTREYRHGDDLRKVHWRATARKGELMVRLEERPWRAQATLLLDTRAQAHLVTPHLRAAHLATDRPRGPAGDEHPPTDSLEWLIEAAASVGTELARRGAVLRAVTAAGELAPSTGYGRLTAEDLLDRLAGVGPSRVASLDGGIEDLCRTAGDGPVICLLGAVGPDDVVELARRRSGPTQDLAVLAEIESWTPSGLGGRRGASAAARAVLAAQREEAAALLRRAGWRVAVATPGRSVADVWAALGAPTASSPGSPLRATPVTAAGHSGLPA
jgi:uncharacterized protein (DUF58 family)